jgi:hypothetical protein
MQCQTCSAQLEPNAQFCPYCGTRVAAPSSAGAPTIAPPTLQSPYQPFDQQPYNQQWIAPGQSGTAPASLPNSTAAVVSLIFGILCWVPVLPVIGAIVAVIAGHIARNQIRDAKGQLGGAGMAKAGLILGYAHLALIALAICVVLALLVLGLLTSRGR